MSSISNRVKIYVPKISFPGCKKKPLDGMKCVKYKENVSEITDDILFREIIKNISLYYIIYQAIINGEEDLEKVKSLLPQVKNVHTLVLRELPNLEDSRKFNISCSILGEDFEYSLCDLGYIKNVMSMAMVERLGIADLKVSSCKFANLSTITPQGYIRDLEVQVGSYLVPTDFYFMKMSGGSNMSLILGRSFLGTASAVVDLSNKRIFFSKITRNVFYDAIPTREVVQLDSCVTMTKKEKVGYCMVMNRTARIRGNRLPNSQPALKFVDGFGGFEKEGKRTINKEDLDRFNMKVRMIQTGLGFKEAWETYYTLRSCFTKSDESMDEIEVLFYKARRPNVCRRTLHKIEDLGLFVVPCSIDGVQFNDSLCDSGACVNVMPLSIADGLGITNLSPSTMIIRLANNSICMPKGELHDVLIQVGNCDVPVDFLVVEVDDHYDSHLIFGRSFLATVGAIMDWSNQMISFANIDKNVFYHPVPSGYPARHVQYQTTNCEGDTMIEQLEEFKTLPSQA